MEEGKHVGPLYDKMGDDINCLCTMTAEIRH